MDDVHKIQFLRGVIFARWILIVVFCILGVIQRFVDRESVFWTSAVWLCVVIFGSVYNICILWVLKRRPERYSLRSLSIVQMLADIALCAFIVYITGAAESSAFILYVAPILVATLLFVDMMVVFTTLCAVATYIIIILLDFFGILPHFQRPTLNALSITTPEGVLLNTISISAFLLFIGFLAVYINRLIQKRTMQLLIERDAVKSLFQSLEDGVVLIDAHGKVLLSNPRAHLLLGVAEEQSIVLQKDVYPSEYHQLLNLLRDHSPYKKLKQETTAIHKEGNQELYVQIDSIPVRSHEGSIVYWLKVIRDVTRERHLEHVKSEFISIAAHQLRTPLAALKWCIKILLDGDAGATLQKQKELLQKAYERNEELIDTVNHLLNVSEIEEGRLQFVFTRTNIHTILQDLVDEANEDAAPMHIRVNYTEPSSALPFIDLDVYKFRVAIQNLIDNAIKYSPAESIVYVRAYIKNKQCIIEVQDQGIGIPKAEQDKIFAKFFRGGRAKEKQTTGSGLGLYIVKNIITQHKGTIHFVSQKGKGTRFIVALPIVKAKKGKKQKL